MIYAGFRSLTVMLAEESGRVLRDYYHTANANVMDTALRWEVSPPLSHLLTSGRLFTQFKWAYLGLCVKSNMKLPLF